MTESTETFDLSPGWYDMPESEYHADPLAKPSHSASNGKTIVQKSALHAWAEHPKNPERKKRKSSSVMNVGSAVHAVVFGGAQIVVVEAGDWRTKLAKEKRDLALSVGKIPILADKMRDIELMASRVSQRFDELYEGEYLPESVGIWACPRSGELRRCRMDSRAGDVPIIVDLKTTEGSVDDDTIIKKIYQDNLQIQEAAYRECLETLHPEWAGRSRFYFQFIEQKAPFALSRPFELPDAGQQLGLEQWAFSGKVWDDAVESGKFRGYSKQPMDAIPPSWTLNAWSARLGLSEEGA